MVTLTALNTDEIPMRAEATESPQKHWPRYHRAVLGLRNYWYPALLSKQIKDKPVGVKLLGEELVFIRYKGQVHCLEGRCKHRGVPLSEGRFEFPCTITCAYHGWTYKLDTGELVAALTDGPESAIVGKVKLRTYPVLERQKVIWAFIGDGPPPPLEDDVPEESLDPSAVVGVRVHDGVGNWRLAMEAAIDPSHAGYLHRHAWLSFFSSMPASRGKYTAELIEGRYLSYKTEGGVEQGDYPGLGRWPREGWWKRRTFGGNTKLKVAGFLPCGNMVVGIPTNVPFNTYSWYVPVDKDHYRWVTFLVARVAGLKKWRACLKYYLWLRWMYQGPRQFLGQDLRINELVHPFYAEQNGWAKERLYQPDVVVTAWRKFVDGNARGIQE